MATRKQIAALKYMIFISRDGVDLSKRVLAFLIDQSEELTREVCLTLVENREGYSADEIDAATHGIDRMMSCNCTTHLNALEEMIGSGLFSYLHYGDFDPTRVGDPFNNDGQFPNCRIDQVMRPGLIMQGMPLRYTFWLSRKPFSWEATQVIATRKELEKINLKSSGLYQYESGLG
jgi:hypothetical protein